MATTARKLKKAEDRIAKAQEALDKTQTGLRAAEEVVAATEKASKRPLFVILALLTIVGVAWVIAKNAQKS